MSDRPGQRSAYGAVSHWRVATALALLFSGAAMATEPGLLILDEHGSQNAVARTGTSWRLITDSVMGGVSHARMTPHRQAGRNCLHLQGDVRLDNQGGFVQLALDLGQGGTLDASGYQGVLLDVYGNAETYNVHLRTTDMWLPWQSYRASFTAPAEWRTIRIPFARFEPYRIRKALDIRHLKRLGVVAIGRAFSADLCIARLALY